MTKVSLLFISLLLCLSVQALDHNDFNIYGKIALVSTMNLQDGSQGLGDNSSRLGIRYTQPKTFENWDIGLRAEWSVSTNRNNSGFGSSNFGGKKYDVVSNDGPFANRLGYLWFKKSNIEISAGKMWSVFYDIPEYTDLFYTDGARASSAYTRTGEVDGTYRASEIIQLRYQHGNIKLGLQTKLTGKETVEYDFDNDGSADSSLVYKQIQAGSLQYVNDNLSLGVSALNLMFDNNGESESQLTLSYGLKLKLASYFLNAVYTKAKDLELTQENNFVHSEGYEMVGGYQLSTKSKLMLGLNRQTRAVSEDFELLYYYLSYSYEVKNLTLPTEYIIGDSKDNDGVEDKSRELKLAASLSF